LFLDFDGTLADLAPRPDLVHVEPELVGTLRALHASLGGALAIISGRPVHEIDHFLSPLVLSAAGVHGAEVRDMLGDGQIRQTVMPSLEPLQPTLEYLVLNYPGLQIERKSAAVAVHYRAVPELEAIVRGTLADAVKEIAGLELLPGKMVVEIKSASVSKGGAIAEFMRSPAFTRRKPLFAGDDVTDEDGFVAVQRLGGAGILVGQRESAATISVTGPAALRCWLHRSAKALASSVGSDPASHASVRHAPSGDARDTSGSGP
jgi:trehalose 6-phosphate phosphatase